MRTADIKRNQEYSYARWPSNHGNNLTNVQRVVIVATRVPRKIGYYGNRVKNDGVKALPIDINGNRGQEMIVRPRQIIRPWREHEILLAKTQQEAQRQKAEKAAEMSHNEQAYEKLKELAQKAGLDPAICKLDDWDACSAQTREWRYPKGPVYSMPAADLLELIQAMSV